VSNFFGAVHYDGGSVQANLQAYHDHTVKEMARSFSWVISCMTYNYLQLLLNSFVYQDKTIPFMQVYDFKVSFN